MNRQRGMTMVELLVSLAIVMLIIGAATTAYLKLLRTYRTQGRLAEGYMANLTGLEMLRYDIEMAGFGLPAGLAGATYSEAVQVNPETNFNAINNPNPTPPYDPSTLNDSPNNPPRALAHLDNSSAANQSDVLTIKSSAANINTTSKKWSMIINGGTPVVKLWGVTALDPVMDFTSGPPADNFIILDNNGNLLPGSGAWGCYMFNASAPNTGYYNNASTIPSPPAQYIYYMYGLDNSTTNPSGVHRMPFNRVDYYLDKIASDFPSSCAANTYTLYRSTVDQATGKLLTQAPLVDCVRDFQVAFGIDPNGDPTQPIQWQANLTGMTAAQIQQQLREVRIFVLYQEGLGDTSSSTGPGSSNFRFSGYVNLGDQDIAHSLDPTNYPAPPNNFQQWSSAPLVGSPQLKTPFHATGADLQYRWKVLEIAVKPMNLLNLQAGTPR